jgi:transcriptional regulator with XRE-family HTH domain
MSESYSIDKRLKLLMKIQGITISELATKANISEDTIKSIRSGKTKNPSLYVLTAIADAFSCTLDNLVGRVPKELDEANLLRKWRSLDNHGRKSTMLLIDDELTKQPATTTRMRQFMYYYSTTYLGNGALFDMNRINYTDIPSTYMTDADFGIKIISDSYLPYYFPGDIVGINKRPPLPGEIACYWKDNIIYIRKYVLIGGVSRYVPINAVNNEIELKKISDYTCLGTIIGLVRQAI